MRKVRTKDGHQITVPEKGERHPGSGRKAGQQNKISMTQKLAMMWAAEHSDHSADHTLQGFYLHMANAFPQDHAKNLNRLLPLQVDARHEIRQKVVYRTSEEIIAGMAARGVPKKVIDAIVTAMAPQVPVPVDRSKPRDLVLHPLPPTEYVKPGVQGHDGDDDETVDVDAIAAAAVRFSNGS
jgi:hypothetical protein